MRKLLWLAMLLAAPPAVAQQVLPAEFVGWTAIPGSQSGARALEGLPGDQAAILRACGNDSLERQTYARGAASLAVTLFRMPDPTSAYSAYSFLRPDDATGVKPTEHSSVSRQRALLLVGNFLLEVSGENLPPLAQDLKALAGAVAPQANRAPYPSLWQHLPLRDLVPRSDRYVLNSELLARAMPLAAGDWLGFADGAEAELARYRINGQQLTLLIAAYPTQQVAAKKLEGIARSFDVNAAGPLGNGRTALFARRVSSLVALVSGTSSAPLADSLLQQIQYKTEVTWNEPSFRLTQPAIEQILEGIFIGTGLILIFALVAGIAFGGVRIVVKHFLPGLVFDRSESVEILQLGLNSKPIEAKDFY